MPALGRSDGRYAATSLFDPLPLAAQRLQDMWPDGTNKHLSGNLSEANVVPRKGSRNSLREWAVFIVAATGLALLHGGGAAIGLAVICLLIGLFIAFGLACFASGLAQAGPSRRCHLGHLCMRRAQR